MPPKTRSNTASTAQNEGKQTSLATMAAKGDDTIEKLIASSKDSTDPNRLLLLNIIANQKTADEKQETRYRNLDTLIQESKQTLEKHIEENDKELSTIKENISKNTSDLVLLQTSVTTLQADLITMQDKYEAVQRLLDQTTTSINNYLTTIGKLDAKYLRDEDEQMRCQLIIDGVKEHGTKRPKTVVTSLLKDLEVDFVDSDIKSAYRLGPINDKATRPRTIRVQFSNTHFKYDIFKNIQKLKGKDTWKGIHISDTVSPEEQDKRRDMRCIFAVGKAKGVNVKLKGSNIIIDAVKFGHSDIYNLPKGLSIDLVKIVATKDGLAFQSHHAYLSNMYPCKIVFENVEYKSSEHLYYAEMARHHNRLDLIDEIIKTKDGYAAKRAGKKIDIADDWETAKVKIVKKIIHLKFDQNDNLRDKLLATKGHLYEVTRGDSFSCGMSLAQAKDIAQDSITKANQLGVILCEYQDEYLGVKI